MDSSHSLLIDDMDAVILKLVHGYPKADQTSFSSSFNLQFLIHPLHSSP